ncbi:hypothetical protein [Ruegeria conchae]|uniref:hypothetical protein n=1 Tax=Ruegeria conchae TaxID=981384 RepID=UPI0029C796A6|nr:hypothetical protein [Ruegeria conchae]
MTTDKEAALTNALKAKKELDKALDKLSADDLTNIDLQKLKDSAEALFDVNGVC